MGTGCFVVERLFTYFLYPRDHTGGKEVPEFWIFRVSTNNNLGRVSILTRMSDGKLALIFESYLILNVSLFSGLPKTIRKPAMHSLGYAGAEAIPKIHFKPCYDFKTI